MKEGGDCVSCPAAIAFLVTTLRNQHGVHVMCNNIIVKNRGGGGKPTFSQHPYFLLNKIPFASQDDVLEAAEAIIRHKLIRPVTHNSPKVFWTQSELVIYISHFLLQV